MTIICTVTNDLSYDQRMHRICEALVEDGNTVLLLGRKRATSIPLSSYSFEQKRLKCFFDKGFLFYAEFNLRIFLFLLFARYDAVCSVDLDTLGAGCFATLLRRKKRVFDAHEYFTEVPEVVHRPFVKWFWGMVASLCLPFYRHAYTVGPALASIFESRYKLPFGVVRNMPRLSAAEPVAALKSGRKRLLYQGAINEGRGIEALLEAMLQLEDFELVLAGEGDLFQSLMQQSQAMGLQDRVMFLGYVKPEDLRNLTREAWLGLNLLENRGLSYYYSLANKFFDSVQAGVPVLTMDFPEYRALNETFAVAILLEELSASAIATAILKLSTHPAEYNKLSNNCLLARKSWNWEQEKQTLLEIWRKV